jgi:hypothetical protein
LGGKVLRKDLEEGARDQEKEKNSNKKMNPSPITKKFEDNYSLKFIPVTFSNQPTFPAPITKLF